MTVVKNGDIAYAGDESAGVLVSFTGHVKGASGSSKSESTKIASENPPGSTGKVAAWGTNNDYPQIILKALEKSGVAGSALNLRKFAHYGNGLIYFKDEYESNKRVKRLISKSELQQEIKDFEKNSQFKRVLKEIIADVETFNIAFPEYIISANYKTINKVKRQQAAFCRFETLNESNEIERVYLSSKWEENPALDGKFVEKVPYIDPLLSAEEVKEICKKKKITKFIRPVMFPLMGEVFYPKTPWHSVQKNGWIDVAAEIPELKKNVFKNQTVILYHIEIAIDYFRNKYGQEKWEAFTAKQQDEKRMDLLTEIDERLTGSQNTHKSIMSLIYKDDAGKYEQGVKITAVDNKLKDGAYLPEASAANSEILFAMQVDPSIIGAGIPGGKLGAGSGSDKREAYTILSALMKTPREFVLETFDFIRDYNGWDEDLQAGFENTVLTTLDKNPTGSENSASV